MGAKRRDNAGFYCNGYVMGLSLIHAIVYPFYHRAQNMFRASRSAKTQIHC